MKNKDVVVWSLLHKHCVRIVGQVLPDNNFSVSMETQALYAFPTTL